MHKILLVEDDVTINTLVKKNLEQWGYAVTDIADFTQVLQVFTQTEPHLVLLDLTLPFFNGYYWCQEIRKVSKVPIVFLSSHDQAMDIVMAINMGADDYVTKPFEMTVLLAKIQGILRRSYEFGGEVESSLLDYQGLVLDLKTTQLHYQGQTLDLTKNEFQILQVLMRHGHQVVSREDLMQALWQSDLFIDDNTLTVNVTRLRKKLGDVGLDQLIVTKKGLGYCLAALEG
ncbi:response regulator transcription factor [Streptococcus moroccensis]|uniref:DNA-binding response OmpR family regulator n=1 Tax=Streptococcus moroccensis TaxID=1451356 RepID=A0ABT9YQM2_9STRE|nr:response regulator transcription factor [Streptococcus moroccensis]MDQ0221598.1 DNA-binding response OmpR family regulator [Streptococcus moroccensis]